MPLSKLAFIRTTVCPGRQAYSMPTRRLSTSSSKHHLALNGVPSNNEPSSSAPMRPKGYWDRMATDQTNPIPRVPPSAYRRYTAFDLSQLTHPPRCAGMSVRDFIQDSLYNPNYGYFSKKALIFSPKEDIHFNAFKNVQHFMNHLGDLYKEIETVSSATEDIMSHVGAGNGTLMLNILEYIKLHHPDLFAITKYNVIEISAKLAAQQHETMTQAVRDNSILGVTEVHDKVRIVNKSIFEWDALVSDECFIIAMEVIDNFAHDLVRYDYTTGTPMQGLVMIDETGEYTEVYEAVSDPLLRRYLFLRTPPTLLRASYRAIRRLLPFAPNLTPPEFIPTKTLQLFDTLHKCFPRHRLILSDFDRLNDGIPGKNGPVVQIRYQGQMIACSTYLVQPGWFDVFFPTDFEELRRVYATVAAAASHGPNEIAQDDGNNCNRYTGRSKGTVRICSQKQFLLENAQLDRTVTKSGENPMLSLYENFQFMLS
ncbi:hypothetical protein SeMB42_g00270 [Synchytrium endobioticum]|uniref:Protein arginine methyltransferase NDUFAF7 n=1 Tax=Synchytrium endobioticum TaxID=286115 RepID=A0A507DUA6_9FUNG|nr:hypothetical protein SeMB42_g00270 [Synchytrium endobioticum]